MGIRSRIIAVVLALVFLALVVLDVVSYSVVRNSLIASADSQVNVSWHRFWNRLSSGSVVPSNLCEGLPNNSFAAIYTLSGVLSDLNTTCSTTGTAAQRRLPPALLSSALSAGKSLLQGVANGQIVGPEVPNVYGSSHGYRLAVAVEPFPYSPVQQIGVVFVLGQPLAPLRATLGKVILLEIIVSGSILTVAGVAAYFLVRLGLRPLEKMAATAGEIATGDLSRRVDETDERTEVGRLGSALNTMLTRIEQAFKEKEASGSRLRRFVADASHELRTPLTSIRGYAELLGRNQAVRPADITAALKRIEGESARMSGLVEDLLLLARLDQGRPLDREPVDLGVILADAARDARVIDASREVTVRAEGALLTLGDDARLRQVVANLVTNALTYSPEGSPLELEGRQAGERVRLLVVDHGPGIPAELRPKVFDRFWRADESRQRAKGGSGLGLSLVAAIVAAHAGTVYVTETPGGGATFVVELPAGTSGPPTGRQPAIRLESEGRASEASAPFASSPRARSE